MFEDFDSLPMAAVIFMWMLWLVYNYKRSPGLWSWKASVLSSFQQCIPSPTEPTMKSLPNCGTLRWKVPLKPAQWRQIKLWLETVLNLGLQFFKEAPIFFMSRSNLIFIKPSPTSGGWLASVWLCHNLLGDLYLELCASFLQQPTWTDMKGSGNHLLSQISPPLTSKGTPNAYNIYPLNQVIINMTTPRKKNLWVLPNYQFIPYDSAILPPMHSPIHIHHRTRTRMFIAALFVMVPDWKLLNAH